MESSGAEDRSVQRQTTDNSVDKQESSDPSLAHRVDLTDMERTAKDVPHTHERNCHLLTSGRGLTLMLQRKLVDLGTQ